MPWEVKGHSPHGHLSHHDLQFYFTTRSRKIKAALDKLWSEFERDLIKAVAQEAMSDASLPEYVKTLIADRRAIYAKRTRKNGVQLIVNSWNSHGRILLVWEFGIHKEYRIYPRFKKALSWYQETGESYPDWQTSGAIPGTKAGETIKGGPKSARRALAWVEYRHPIPPHRFIQRAWDKTMEVYKVKLREAMTASVCMLDTGVRKTTGYKTKGK